MRKTWLDFHEPPRWPQHVVAYGERIHVVGRWQFLVESKSEGGLHCIDLEPIYSPLRDGRAFYVEYEPGCTCTSWRVRGECRHMAAVLSLYGLDNDLGST